MFEYDIVRKVTSKNRNMMKSARSAKHWKMQITMKLNLVVSLSFCKKTKSKLMVVRV